MSKLTAEDRKELARKHAKFMKERVFETFPIDTEEYMAQTMTGSEAYKVMQNVLFRWEALTGGNEYIYWLATQLGNDIALQEDFAHAIREMIEGRKNGIDNLVYPPGYSRDLTQR